MFLGFPVGFWISVISIVFLGIYFFIDDKLDEKNMVKRGWIIRETRWGKEYIRPKEQ